MKSQVWSVALYGSESWMQKEVDMRKITAFELWAWQRMLCVSWTEKKSNMGMPDSWSSRRSRTACPTEEISWQCTDIGSDNQIALL